MIFSEVKIFQPDSFEDYRGELYTLFKQEEHELVFNHDKVSVSKQNVLRGLHGDSKAWKLITCLAGEIYLVVVDNRPSSDTYLTWDSIILTGKNRKQVLVPPMFANGHLVLSSEATFFYKWSYPGEYPDVKDQFSLNWRDPKINIYWPIDNPILSKRDKNSH
jgi:dTDP-4-dehydrorhamnose 3,5-epimerase